LAALIILAINSIRHCDIFFLLLVSVFLCLLGVILQSYFPIDFGVPSTSQIILPLILPLISANVDHIDIKEKYNADKVELLGGEGKRVAAYKRVSTKRQAKYGRSLDVQDDKIKDLVVKEKPSILISYTDEGISGRSVDNRKIPWIIKLAEDHLIDELWACDFKRLGRNALDTNILFFILAKLGVVIRTLEHVYTSDSLSDLIMVVIESANAEKENIERTNKVNDSKRKNFQEKKWNKIIPLGYEKDGKWLKKIEKWISLIFDIYSLFIQGLNLNEVARRINIKYADVIVFQLEARHVKSILSDPIYVGKPEHLKKIVEDASLKFIEPEMYDKAEKRLNEIHEKYKRPEIGPFEKHIFEKGFDPEDYTDIQIIIRDLRCGNDFVKNGTKYTGGFKQQNYKCKCREIVLPPKNNHVKDKEVNPLNSIYLKKEQSKNEPPKELLNKNTKKSKKNITKDKSENRLSNQGKLDQFFSGFKSGY